MKKLSILIALIILIQLSLLSQQNRRDKIQEPLFFKVTTHDSNIKELPAKSFYESKSDWQYIIDTTWGPGLPLAEKQQIFNTYANSIREDFDGFESLQMNENTWDSLRAYYFDLIGDSTSKGGFSAIMSKFSMHLQDLHTYAYNESVVLSPLNPGIPVLVISGFFLSIQHFGAVITALPDSSLLILRTVENHPLDLEPGDILLGYEGVPWKVLVNELLDAGDAGLPAIGKWGGAPSAMSDGLLLGAGMNWHLFDTIDILKHSTGDTVHLSVAPLLNLPPIDMLNNEQLSVPGVSFPNWYNQQYVSYGIIDGTNIGYIYLWLEVEGISDQQFYEAVTALSETDALIIDMRINGGGWAFFNNSLEILLNETHLTIEDAYRCNTNDFTLCPSGNSATYKVPGNPPDFYDRPIAIFLGPTCVSMGDVTAQRFRYHPTVRFFAKSSGASLGDNVLITNYPNWVLKYSIGDMFHVNAPGEYLNRKEFPIDYPVWFDPDDVANGYDTVVEEALEWINNLVYGHDVITNSGFASPGIDTVIISATVENPNSHNVLTQIFVKDLNNMLIDSLELLQAETGEVWQGKWLSASYEDYFKLDIKTTDQNTGETFTINNVNHITTAGPVVIEQLDITYLPGPDYYCVKPHIKNEGQTITLDDLWISMSSEDTSITSIAGNLYVVSIAPGQTIIHPGYFIVVTDSNFSGVFSLNFDITRDSWSYWKDSLSQSIVTFALDVSIIDGWNMVSVPGVNPLGQGVSTWWPGLTGSVYKFGAGYQVVTTTTPSEGYWMKHTGAQVYSYPAIEIVPHDPIVGASGWNLIGGYENSVATSSLTTTPSGLITGTIYKYGGLGYIPATDIVPGYAYWVKLTGAGNINIPSGELAKEREEEYFKEDWGKIILTDATGRIYTLYAVNGDSPMGGARVDLDLYELPPAPPQGMFDIRYGSGRIAEDINSSLKEIDMQGVTYPLTVKVENMNMRIMDETGKKINKNIKDGEEIVIKDAQIQKLMVSGELLPTVYALEQNYPNPFNPVTTIKFTIPKEVQVNLSVFNILGEKVTELKNEVIKSGYYEVKLDASNLASGVYLYRIKAGDFIQTKKMILMK